MVKNKSENICFLFLTLSSLVPIAAVAGILSYLVKLLQSRWSFFPVFLLFSVVIGVLVKSFFQVEALYDLLPDLNKLLTLIFLALFAATTHENLSKVIVRIASILVPVSILVSFLHSTGMVIISGARTSSIGPIDRLFFPFIEPSHFAIFLALSSVMAVAQKRFMSFFVLLAGLILTWSLSGWMIFSVLILIFCYLRFSVSSAQAKFKWLAISVPVILASISLLVWLVNESAWLSYKIEQLIRVVNGESAVSSAFVRYHSTFLGFEFLKESFAYSDISNMVLGMPASDAGYWISSYYYQNYGLEVLPSSFNALSSLILNFGIVGLAFVLLVILLFNKTNRVKPGWSTLLMYVIVSMFHGYAFGFLSVLYFAMTMICTKEVARA